MISINCNINAKRLFLYVCLCINTVLVSEPCQTTNKFLNMGRYF